MKRVRTFLLLASAAAAHAQSVELATVVARPVSRNVELPGEIYPFLSVGVHAKVPGYVERVLVDRGSVVKEGELLATLSAPEMAARIAEAESKARAADSDRAQAAAQLIAAQSTLGSLKKAAETPGVVAGNDVVQAQQQVDAAQAVARSRQQAFEAAQSAVQAQRDLEKYLQIAAPFEGVVTDRLVHPGALVGPGADLVLLVIQQTSRLRVVVPVPEEDVSGMARGASVPFHVPAWPERTFTGTIARSARALDPKSRTMPVELDVANRDGALAPGMYPAIQWPVRRSRPALFVPKTSVASNTERTFVIRDQGGRAQWVDVKKGAADGDLIEVTGNLRAGDKVVKRATDELRDGAALAVAR